MSSLKQIMAVATLNPDVLDRYMDENPQAFSSLEMHHINQLEDDIIQIGAAKGVFNFKPVPVDSLDSLKPALIRAMIDHGVMVNEIAYYCKDRELATQAIKSFHLDVDHLINHLDDLPHSRKIDIIQNRFDLVRLDPEELMQRPYMIACLILHLKQDFLPGPNALAFLTEDFIKNAHDVVLWALAKRGVCFNEAFDNGSSYVRVEVIKRAKANDIKKMVIRNGGLAMMGRDVQLALAKRGLFTTELIFNKDKEVSVAALRNMKGEPGFDYHDIRDNLTMEHVHALVDKGLFLKDILMEKDLAGKLDCSNIEVLEIVEKIAAHEKFKSVPLDAGDIQRLPSEFLVRILPYRKEFADDLSDHPSAPVRLQVLRYMKDDPDDQWLRRLQEDLKERYPDLVYKFKDYLIERGMYLDALIFDQDRYIALSAAREILKRGEEYEIDYSLIDAAIQVYSRSSQPSLVQLSNMLKRIMQLQENKHYPDATP